MPKRTNDFQKLVKLIREHLRPEAPWLRNPC